MGKEKCKFCGSETLEHINNKIERTGEGPRDFKATRGLFACEECGKVTVIDL